jgi:hypothetical protein
MTAALGAGRNRHSGANTAEASTFDSSLQPWSEPKMLNTNENKPIRKSGRRSRKAEQESGKAEQRRLNTSKRGDLKPDPQDAETQASVTLTESSPSSTSVADIPPNGPVSSAETAPISLQILANAYGDYTKKSFEQTKCFFEELAGVRSLEKAFELQTDFAKQACETFIAETQKIGKLHSELARQRLMRFMASIIRSDLILPPARSYFPPQN